MIVISVAVITRNRNWVVTMIVVRVVDVGRQANKKKLWKSSR